MAMNCDPSHNASDGDAGALFAAGHRLLKGNGSTTTMEHTQNDNQYKQAGCLPDDKQTYLTITDAALADATTIVGFQLDMALESEGLTLARDRVEKGVNATLRDGNKGRYIVAKDSGKVVGSLMLTREWSDWNAEWYWWIQSVYVVPAYRKKGVFSQMYGRVMELARLEHVRQVRLYVDKDNRTAQKTYGSLGMCESHYRLYEQCVD